MRIDGGHHLRFPGGGSKALSMSYDDGSEHDRRLVALFNAHGLAASFHLTSSALGEPWRIRREEVAALYAGHEVACHGATHADLTRLDDAGVRAELAADRASLAALTGQPVRGLAYAYGAHDARIERLAGEAGFAYGRGLGDAGDLALPAAPMALATTCHHGQALARAPAFLDAAADRLVWMRVRGHSFELDGFMTDDRGKDWGYMEEFCRRIAAAGGVWAAPLLAVLDYLAAARSLVVTATAAGQAIRNPSPLPLWIAPAAGGPARPIAPASDVLLP